MPTLPGPFTVVARRRPVEVVSGVGARALGPGTTTPLPRPAPYAALVADLDGDRETSLSLASGATRLSGVWAAGRLGLAVTAGGRTTEHRSRRHGRPDEAPDALGLALTGTHLAVLSRAGGVWTVRGRVDLRERLDTHDERWLAGLTAEVGDAAVGAEGGAFGLLGLRDIRVVSHADGSPWSPDGAAWLSATAAGPGFFDTAHTGVWRLDPHTLDVRRTAHLFFRRPDRPGVFGDHATHLVRDGERWLAATSTWGDFSREDPDRGVRITLAASTADLLHGEHVLDTGEMRLGGHTGIGCWDPHLVRVERRWMLGLASARRYFDFHPALAVGESPDDLDVVAAATDRRATEGTTLHRLDDGRDGPRGRRARFPVLDLDLRETGALEAPYPTNLPWPTIVDTAAGRLMVTFDGTPAGGPLPGYGTHGDLVVMREERGGPDPAAGLR